MNLTLAIALFWLAQNALFVLWLCWGLYDLPKRFRHGKSRPAA